LEAVVVVGRLVLSKPVVVVVVVKWCLLKDCL
jgi:hypothetical protein